MRSLCRDVLKQLDSNEPLVLAVIMDHEGSAPRTAGARMLIFPDGSILGTVGGGRYEADTVAAALTLFTTAATLPPEQARRAGCLVSFSLKGVTDMDMICGGALTLLLQYLPADTDTRALFAKAQDAVDRHVPFAFITRLTEKGACEQSERDDVCTVHAERFLCLTQESDRVRIVAPDAAAATPPPSVLTVAQEASGPSPRHCLIDGEEYLVEPFPRLHHLLVFGGGHVSRDVAALARQVGFEVTIFEDRPEFATTERFPGATCTVLPSLDESTVGETLSQYHPGSMDGIVIVTRGHAFDRDVLAAALRTSAGYIGMIGSKSKRLAVYKQLREQGFSQESLDAVHSPIGLAIGAETPQEIAVSIVGELIAWRSNTPVLK